jgi:hypothetical protein
MVVSAWGRKFNTFWGKKLRRKERSWESNNHTLLKFLGVGTFCFSEELPFMLQMPCEVLKYLIL